MSYDLLTEIKFAESYSFLNHRLGESVFERPPTEKWSDGDCPKCHNVFCVSKVSKKNGGGVMCFKCGYRPQGG